MPASRNVDWSTCAQDDCIGARLPTGDRCWAHADQQDLKSALKRLSEGGRLDARGVQVTATLLKDILAVAPRDERGWPTLTAAQFQQATFVDDARFEGVVFYREATFDMATFEGDADFNEATFQGRSSRFLRATFLRDAMFIAASFQGYPDFTLANFQGKAEFAGATFDRGGHFEPESTGAGFGDGWLVKDVWLSASAGDGVG